MVTVIVPQAWGRLAPVRVIDYAQRLGFHVHASDKELIERYVEGDDEEAHLIECLCDDAAYWLNRHAPRNTYYEWHDGEFLSICDEFADDEDDDEDEDEDEDD